MLAHIAEHALAIDEVGAPGRVGIAKLLGAVACDVRHDEDILHPGRLGAD